jgi:hypothetical protein
MGTGFQAATQSCYPAGFDQSDLDARQHTAALHIPRMTGPFGTGSLRCAASQHLSHEDIIPHGPVFVHGPAQKIVHFIRTE